MYWTVGPSLAAFLAPFAHRWNVASLSMWVLLWRMFTLAEVNLLPNGNPLVIQIGCMIFPSPFLDAIRLSL